MPRKPSTPKAARAVKVPAKVTPLPDEPVTIPDTTPKPMEVHHHPDVEKKGFKEYLLEGLMIFLAVTMGFFAESLREHIADHDKELQYISSMIEDARTDTLNYQKAINLNTKRALYLDSLANICFDFKATPDQEEAMYVMYRHAIVHPDLVTPVERTITQLNTGGMRLINNKVAADSIVTYSDCARKLYDQQGYYELYQNKSVDKSFILFNWKSLIIKRRKDVDVFKGAKLLNENKTDIQQFGNEMTVYEGVVSFYADRLKQSKQHAVNLIHTLQQQYKIEE